MENEMAVVPEVKFDLALARAPKQVLAEAQEAAKALQSVISNRKNAVKFNGKHYLSFEDWQTAGRFYGITAKIVSTEVVEIDGTKGFMARAEAISTQTGQVLSAADSMCMNDEPNWKSKPLFQLRSMAQTRAAAKSLRNVLAWVVVLAGYEPSVAEEMTGDEGHEPAPIKSPTPKVSAPVAQVFGGKSEDPNTLTFVPDVVSVKTGEKNGKTWQKIGIKHGEDWYGSFDENIIFTAREAKDKKTPVVLVWKQDGAYRTIVSLTNAA